MKKSGRFTLVDVLVVIGTVAILAAIVIPRLLVAGREERESMLKADLQEMRNAIGRFNQECGDYPSRLEDIMAVDAPKVGANGDKIDPKKFKGPYLKMDSGELPKNPFNRSNLVGLSGIRRGNDPVGWIYDPRTGKVKAESGTASDGTNYSNW